MKDPYMDHVLRYAATMIAMMKIVWILKRMITKAHTLTHLHYWPKGNNLSSTYGLKIEAFMRAKLLVVVDSILCASFTMDVGNLWGHRPSTPALGPSHSKILIMKRVVLK
ncbi:predicted protein [Lichtheimia corymbifera JMRC:FSU:9682]|uniref:Uncharacterized protein n=1 Tax=Lichtheimia corymbifera JMRC:FSU:9682 TaxID=1263082 RepID=A0A068S2K1_9FUNG|nr:predicted protein [Lichtheimia corymbifera JMRC:FSU:9682]